MKKIGVIIGLSLSLGLVGCFEKPKEEVASSQIERVESDVIIEVDGRIIAKNKRDIYIDFPAEVAALYVDQGDVVEKGNPVLTLEFKDYKGQIELKKKGISLYEIELKELKNSLDPQANSLGQLEQTKRIKENQLDEKNDPDFISLYAQLELTRDEEVIAIQDWEVSKELGEIGASSPKEIEQLEQQVKIKQKKIQSIEGEIEKLQVSRKVEVENLKTQIATIQAQMTNTDKERQAKIETLSKQIEMANMEIEQMESKLDLVYLQENDLVASGTDWIVIGLNCEKGSKTQYIQGPILQVIDKNSLVVEIDIPEEYFDEVGVGSKVKVIPYFDEEVFAVGVIGKLSEVVTESYGENVIKGEIKLDKQVDWMKLGLGVDVEIE